MRALAIVGRRGDDGVRQLAIPFLMDEVWSAVSDGGQLQWVADDSELLLQLARAHVYVRTMIFLERELFDATHSPTSVATFMSTGADGQSRRTNPGEIIATRYAPYFDHLDQVSIAAINEAQAMMRKRLGQDVTCPG